MSGMGTGYPIWFKCPQERRDDYNFSRERQAFGAGVLRPVHRKRRTGRTKPAPSPGKGHPRKLQLSHEYVCSCGHRGWTCHVDVMLEPLEDS